MPHPPARRSLVPAAALLLAVLAGCSADPAPTVLPTVNPPSALAPVSGETVPTPPSEDGPALAEREGDVNGQPAVLEVLSLRRSGTLVDLDLRLTNRGDRPVLLGSGTFGTGPADSTLAGVSLVDGVHRKRYVPVRDEQDRCLCSGTALTLDEASSTVLSATFAAPPTDLESVQVDVPSFGSFDLAVQG